MWINYFLASMKKLIQGSSSFNAFDAVNKGSKNIIVKSVYNDVIVLVVAYFVF